MCKTFMMSEIINGIHVSKSMYQVKFSSYNTISLCPMKALKHREKCLEVLPTFGGIFVVQEG